MSKVVLFFIFIIPSIFAFSIEDALVLLKTDKQKAIQQLESLFDLETDLNKRAEISYLISLDTSTKTKNSKSYYIQNTLLNFKNLSDNDRYRLIRVMADLSFKEGKLEKALEYYNQALSRPEFINGMEDYLTLQKSWVLINLNQYDKALITLSDFLKREKTNLSSVIYHDFGKFIVEALYNKNIKFNITFAINETEFFNGLFSGFNRVHGDREVLYKYLLNQGLYNSFFSYGINFNKFHKKSGCDYLVWKLPSVISNEDGVLLAKKATGCNEASVKKLVKHLYGRKHNSFELALLSRPLSKKISCDIANKRLDFDRSTQIIQFVMSSCLTERNARSLFSKLRSDLNRNDISKALTHQLFKKDLLESWNKLEVHNPILISHILYELYYHDKSQFDLAYNKYEEILDKNSPSGMMLLSLNQYYKHKKLDSSLVATFKKRHKEFSLDQKINMVHLLILDGHNILVEELINNQPDIFYKNKISDLIISRFEQYSGIKEIPIISFLNNEQKNFSIIFNLSDLIKLKGKISNANYKSLKLFYDLKRLNNQSFSLKYLEQQDRYFYRLVNVLNKSSKQQWTNKSMREKYRFYLKELLLRSRKRLSKNKTEISSSMSKVLLDWEYKI
jgi:hypothetical protein